MANNNNSNPNGIIKSGTYYAAALIIAVIGGFWVVMQTEISNLKDADLLTRQHIDTVTNERKADVHDLQTATEKRQTEIIKQIDIINAELVERRKEFLTTRDYEIAHRGLDDNLLALQKEIDIIRDQVKIIEQTKPGATELQSVSNGLKDRIDKLYQMIDSINAWIQQHSDEEQNRFEPKK